jgi:hypothetical protein
MVVEPHAQGGGAQHDFDVGPIRKRRRRVFSGAPSDADGLDAVGRAEVEPPGRGPEFLVVVGVQPSLRIPDEKRQQRVVELEQ